MPNVVLIFTLFAAGFKNTVCANSRISFNVDGSVFILELLG